MLTVTLNVEEPKSLIPVGIDIGIKKCARRFSLSQDVLLISGNQFEEKARSALEKPELRIQCKKSSKKELGKDSRSVRRVLKSLSRKQSNKTKTFCRETAAKLCK